MASLVQADLVSALQKLGLEAEMGGPPGSPEKLKITADTVKKVQSLVGKSIEVNADGRVTGL